MSVRHWGIRAVLVTVLLLAFVGALAGVVPAAAVASGGGQLGWSPSLSSFAAASSEARAAGAHPVITRLSLSAAKPGARLTISGRGLGARRGKGSVLFGAFKATSYLRWSATKIVCKVPIMPAGRVLVKVRTVRGTSRGKVFTVAGLPTAALMKLGTVNWTRTSSYDEWNWANADFLAYYTDSAGDLAIVTQHPDTATLSISTIDPSTLQHVGHARSISLPAGWPEWGGFYAGSDGCFYVLVGRWNRNEEEDRNVVAVRRYDQNWALLGTAYIPAGKFIYRPFCGNASHMVLMGARLVVHMSIGLYADEGIHHECNFTFEVDVDTMTEPSDYDNLAAYCSHSMQQLVAMNGTSLITIDHGDGYPRAIQMGVNQPVAADVAEYPGQRGLSAYDLFEFNGTIGDNYTGATVTSLVSGPSGIVVLGNSIRQPNAPNGPLGNDLERRNVYAVWADPATGEHTIRWLTDFAPFGTEQALEPRVVQVASDRYAVLFSVHSHGRYRMEYRLINSAGTVLASTSFSGVFFCAISDPILIGGKVYWVGIEPHPTADRVPDYLFGINVSDPTRPSLLTGAAP